jgi:prevent-host-death family protein
MMYTAPMVKQYSIAEAQRDLPSVMDLVTSGSEVLLTQRGRIVAVVVSVERYAALKLRRGSFAEAYAEFRGEFPRGVSGLGPRQVRSLRHRDGGRAVSL